MPTPSDPGPVTLKRHPYWNSKDYFDSLFPEKLWELLVQVVNRELVLANPSTPHLQMANIAELKCFYGKYIHIKSLVSF